MSVALTIEEAEFVKNSLSLVEGAHSHTWSRRSYAPMLIHKTEMQLTRQCIQKNFPEYVIAFDVVFESIGNRVAWHCDYESIGPFEYESLYKSIDENHFLSVHFNLTDNGGSLQTLEWTTLSYIMNVVIKWYGIFSTLHFAFAYIIQMIPFVTTRSNMKYMGNVFNNFKLHAVTSGNARTSYVVRLVKKNCVKISTKSINAGMVRSRNCDEFERFKKMYSGEFSVDVCEFPWNQVNEPEIFSKYY